MKKVYLLVTIIFQIGLVSGYSQTAEMDKPATVLETKVDTISKTKRGYFIGTKALATKKDLILLLKSNPASKKVYNKSETLEYILLVPALIGGFMIGHPLGASLAGKEMNLPLLGAGIGITAATLITSTMLENSGTKKAIKAYNKHVLDKKNTL